MRERIKVAMVLVASLAAGVAATSCSEDDETTLTVMSFNIWGGGANEDRPVDDTVAAIEAVDPDIVGIQETQLEGPKCTARFCPPRGHSVARELAEALGYQPYQLLDIPYGGAPFIDTEAEAIRFAERTRGSAIELLRGDLAEAGEAGAAFVFGDFNEPSGHDWTQEAVEAGNQPIEVNWPTTRALEDEGFVDAFRAAHPDPVARPAFTWTPSSKPTADWDHHDRIDFVLARADDLEVERAAIVGEKRPEADIVARPWPSDHRAVTATVRWRPDG